MLDATSLSILLVDDDATFRNQFGRVLTQRGHRVLGTADPAAAEEWCRTGDGDLAILDLKMPVSGLELLVRLRQAAGSELAIFILTGFGSIATAVDAVRNGATDYLTKPVDADQVFSAYDRFLGVEVSEGRHYSVPSLDRVEWEHIHRVLQECDGNVSRASRLLGLHRQSLQRKLRKRPSD